MLPALIFLILQIPLTLATSCPAGGLYDSTFNKCYIYYKQPAIFLAAESTCRSIGGNLAEIRNGFENSFVSGVVYNSKNGTTSPSPYWIGVNLLMASKWTWTTNDTAVYTNWAADQPADPSSFQCASVRDDSYLWNKELCSSARPFVCTANPSADPSSTPCDPGYTQYENQCYSIFKDFVRPMNYYDSAAFCLQNERATLPKITSHAVQDFLYSFTAGEKSHFWLGLVCASSSVSDDCYWWDNSHPGFANFGPDYPGMSSPIAMLYPSGQWASHSDFLALATVVICQKPARNS